MNTFPFTKKPNGQEVPNNWKWTLNSGLTSYLKIDIIIRMSMPDLKKSFWGKVYHWNCQHNLCVLFQFLIEELYQLLGLTLTLTRKQDNIAICFVKHQTNCRQFGWNIGAKMTWCFTVKPFHLFQNVFLKWETCSSS